MGWLEAGPVLLRLDIAERVAAELAWATRRGPTALPAGLASRFSLKVDLLPVVLRRLGFRVVPAGVLPADQFGPPAPAMLLPLRRRRTVATQPLSVQAPGPFAALAALKR
jgi:ATP-dependent RNA helicase SUPV3L1/SUV3